MTLNDIAARQPFLRVPPARPRGILGRLIQAWTRRAYGDDLDPGYVLWHHKPVMLADIAWERKIGKWRALDPDLKNLAVMASAASIGCSWCLDFGYYLAHSAGHSAEKLRQVPAWRDSSAFTDTERLVLAYSEAMTATPPTVTDQMVSDLTERIGVKAVVELTMMVAVENQRSRFNSAMGLRSQGFRDRCDVAP